MLLHSKLVSQSIDKLLVKIWSITVALLLLILVGLEISCKNPLEKI